MYSNIYKNNTNENRPKFDPERNDWNMYNVNDTIMEKRYERICSNKLYYTGTMVRYFTESYMKVEEQNRKNYISEK